MPTSSPGRLVVAAAVLNSLTSPTHVLCAARAYPPEHAGQYELPGGKVEPGEHPEHALRRELAEELSLSVILGPEVLPTAALAVAAPTLDPRTWPGDDRAAWPAMHGFRMRVWLAQPASGQPRCGHSHSRLDWIALDDAASLAWLPADLPIVPAVIATARACS